jgi:hypothetical protein
MTDHTGTWSPQTTTLPPSEQCRCCGGTGTQLNIMTGLLVRCPCCGGTGLWNQPQQPVITCEVKT